MSLTLAEADDHEVARHASCFGACRDCGEIHSLPHGNAPAHARALMREFEEIGRLDHLVPSHEADPRLSFDFLFPGGHGNMFGVLECLDRRGRTVVLRAFSSLRRGIRDVDGWVPPILSAEAFYGLVLPEQQRIERLTAEIERLDPGSPARLELVGERTRISRALFREMQGLYRFRNFRDEERSLEDARCSARPLPGGVGECCAPKLLNHAAARGLRPVGLAEFYWGDARSPSLRSGSFYTCCETRCQPILGFMLCGL